jgi:hypothetical protein
MEDVREKNRREGGVQSVVRGTNVIVNDCRACYVCVGW